jgi:alpha-1,6-mannosyltransferase
MKPGTFFSKPPGGLIPLVGTILFAAFIPLIRYPSLIGEGVAPFLCSFCAAGLAYVLALKRLERENPSPAIIWIFAVLFRLILLLTPVTLSEDVYRYIWDGHLLNSGVNPYAAVVNSPLLDSYSTPLRERVNYPWLATPYLPAAQLYFALVEWIAPQTPRAFQAGAMLLDLASAGLVMVSLKRLNISGKAILVYLWNPLIVVEFSQGAHIDVLMVFFIAAGLWGLVSGKRGGLLLSVLAWAAAVLVKGWPILSAPLFANRWGIKRLVLFGLGVALPLAFFAVEAGWGFGDTAGGQGVFGALRVYTTAWKFNGGLYHWLGISLGAKTARLISLLIPGFVGILLGVEAWLNEGTHHSDLTAWNRVLIRWAILPFSLFLLVTPTIHPWYLALVFILLPFFWPAVGEDTAIKRWIWPWIYFMFFEAFTYLSYIGITTPPAGLEMVQTVAYLPFWGLLIWAGSNRGFQMLDLPPVSSIIMKKKLVRK